jgi:uroporphyrinogen III methyltransferase/synthase
VPLTHREHTSVVTLVTGHDPDKIDWSRVSGAETVVIYMGISHAREIAGRMMACGRPADTPTLTARWATRSEQAIITAPLGELGDAIEAAEMKPPATIIIGEVVRLHDRLTWYEKLPLFGQRVVVTRPEHQAEELASRLRAAGAEPLLAPVIATVARDSSAIDAAVARLSSYDWLIFTSVNGVRFFVERLDASGRDLRSLNARICAIGPATRAAVEKLHLKVDLMPLEYVAESVVQAFAGADLKGKRVLLPRAAVARDLIPRELEARGALVDVVEAYRTVRPADASERIERALARHPHWVTFTSASTVENFIGAAGAAPLAGLRIATIGPVTSAAAREHGLHVDVEAKEYTVGGLVAALIEFRKE